MSGLAELLTDLGILHLPLFIGAGLLLNLTPGPDVLYIITSGVKAGWRTGAVAALGITAGCFVHIAAAALGVSALVAASATAFSVLKWLGAAYLVYVGWSMLGIRQKSSGIPKPGSESEFAINSIATPACFTGARGIFYS